MINVVYIKDAFNDPTIKATIIEYAKENGLVVDECIMVQSEDVKSWDRSPLFQALNVASAGSNFIVYDLNWTSNEATVTITIDPVNDAPVVSNVSYSLSEDSSIEIQLEGFDIENDELLIEIDDIPENGDLLYQGNDIYLYIPDDDYYGNDLFTYTVLMATFILI